MLGERERRCRDMNAAIQEITWQEACEATGCPDIGRQIANLDADTSAGEQTIVPRGRGTRVGRAGPMVPVAPTRQQEGSSRLEDRWADGNYVVVDPQRRMPQRVRALPTTNTAPLEVAPGIPERRGAGLYSGPDVHDFLRGRGMPAAIDPGIDQLGKGPRSGYFRQMPEVPPFMPSRCAYPPERAAQVGMRNRPQRTFRVSRAQGEPAVPLRSIVPAARDVRARALTLAEQGNYQPQIVLRMPREENNRLSATETEELEHFVQTDTLRNITLEKARLLTECAGLTLTKIQPGSRDLTPVLMSEVLKEHIRSIRLELCGELSLRHLPEVAIAKVILLRLGTTDNMVYEHFAPLAFKVSSSEPTKATFIKGGSRDVQVQKARSDIRLPVRTIADQEGVIQGLALVARRVLHPSTLCHMELLELGERGSDQHPKPVSCVQNTAHRTRV